MSHMEQLVRLLEPLGVYDLNGPWNAGELEAQGLVLDQVFETLEELNRERDLSCARSWGLERTAELFTRKPAAPDAEHMRAALAALLRIGGDSFTLAGINDTISGCGINARVRETDKPGTVEVSFPDVPGIPAGFQEISAIIEDILPAHLLVEYVYWYITWSRLEAKRCTWRMMENRHMSWTELETWVD